MKLTSSMELKTDFKNFNSPPRADVNEANNASETRDMEGSAIESGTGQPLYNAEIYGSLRKGGAVDFFSKECIGLVAATFASTFAIECLSSVIRPMMREHFGYNSAELGAFRRLSTLPTVLCFFFGLLSDSYPIMGYRRKGYLLIGVTTTVVSVFVLAGMDMFLDGMEQGSARSGLAAAVVMFAALASTGNLLMFLCVQTRVMELSQREPLGLRGSILGTYLMFRSFVYIITDSTAYIIAKSTPHHYVALLTFGVVVALPIPLIWTHWEEKYYSLSTPMKTRGQILWKIMQQKAVWSVLAFICFYVLFTDITFNGPESVITMWTGASDDNWYFLDVIYHVTTILTIAAWRYYFMNRPWRTFYAVSIALLVVPKLVVATCVSQDIIRTPYFYRIMTIFVNISCGMGMLVGVAPLTEIIQEGSEGAMVGLILSLYFLLNMFVDTNNSGLFDGSYFYDLEETGQDTSSARADVLRGLLVNYGINALAFIGLFFLPRQKLDAQQLRSYGGYTKCASAAIVIFAATLLLYSLTITAMTFIPGTSCLSITGGNGC